ncbi:hypothetical protein Sme01_62710 [Sphaerisporangium melleum]|uniref:Uncharacterized protein n=1 Tax=Sphaerisporangium melleum TaxID=321316 RepID=A0A917R138_9ACTN|nr:hypothetical protein [Sphaerisporangium melleum]GGK81859.1 hypothetical protein GCM10007964_25630 [Sphaerisporangium melleum]GII73795.1 hypothetical protein Sme01_62710 [Sphaerisporangium melleum]
MGQRTTSRRAAALRKAREAKAARDAERLLRERRVEAALADFFESASLAERIRHDAGRRAERILAEAEREARNADAAAGAAIGSLRELGQTNAEIAELCGLSVPVVRAMANSAPDKAPDDRVDEVPSVPAQEHDGGSAGSGPGARAAPLVTTPARFSTGLAPEDGIGAPGVQLP